MKLLTTITLLAGAFALAILIAAFSNYKRSPGKNYYKPAAGKGFSLIELFTSEGCSSCPPADEVLAKIQKEIVNQPIFVIAYHVDYWNRLGWKDKFSRPEFSKRQMDYGNLLNAQIYTPQVIINGKEEYVGSDEQAIRKALSRAVNTASSTTLKLDAQQNDGQIALNYQATGTFPTYQLLVALVQKSAVSKVSNGENSGRTLYHAQIVSQLQTVAIAAKGKGAVSIKLPADFNPQNWELIGFIQDTTTGEIFAADKVKLTNNTATLKP